LISTDGSSNYKITLDSEIVTSLDSENITSVDFKITLSVKQLSATLKSVRITKKNADLLVSIVEDGSFIIGNDTYRMDINDNSYFDNVKFIDIKYLDSLPLVKPIRMVRPVIADSHPISHAVTCLFLDWTESQLTLVGSDGHRLAVAEVKVNRENKLTNCLIQKPLVDVLLTFDDSNIDVYCDDENYIQFRQNNLILQVAKTHGKFPDYHNILNNPLIKKGYDVKLDVKTLIIINKLINDLIGKKAHLPVIKAEIVNNEFVLIHNDVRYAICDIDDPDCDIKFSINPFYLMSVLDGLDPYTTFRICSFNDKPDKIVIYGDQITYIVMLVNG
jgi:hypothetical protein